MVIACGAEIGKIMLMSHSVESVGQEEKLCKPQSKSLCFVLSVFAMVSNGVDTVPLCWHASQCPWHRRGRCLFRHRTDDAGVKPSMTGTEEDIGAELAALWAAVSKMASSLMWRTGQEIAVPMPQIKGGAHHEAGDNRGDGRDAGNHCHVGRSGRHLSLREPVQQSTVKDTVEVGRLVLRERE